MTDEDDDPLTDVSTDTTDRATLPHQSSTWKVLGKIAEIGATGVLGHATATTGTSRGVHGVVDSAESGAAGVRGDATQVSGQTYGVEGITDSTEQDATGVRGEATQGNGGTYGVRGITNAETGRFELAAGVKGNAPVSAGDAEGVVGRTNAPGFVGSFGIPYYAAGVRGKATSTSGSVLNAGVYASADGSGVGVLAHSSSGTGIEVSGVSRNSLENPIPADHAHLIADFSTVNSAVLALQAGYDEANSQTADEHNFISFFDTDGTAVGSIVNDSSGGINTQSGTADYAEFMPRADPAETMDAGDVVGVVGGEITKHTADVDQAMVITDQPIVTGNSPGQDPEARSDYETVAFVGQVPVNLRGTAEEGDLIVPSGDHDGTARAIAPEDWTPGDGPLVGRAWESSDTDAVDEVIVAVGLETGEAVQQDRTDEIEHLRAELDRKDDRIESLEREVEELRAEKKTIRARHEDLRAETERLRSENEALHDRLSTIDDRLSELEAGGTSPASADD